MLRHIYPSLKCLLVNYLTNTPNQPKKKQTRQNVSK